MCDRAALAARLAQADCSGLPVVIGFDAFIDEVIQVVDERQDVERARPMATIGDFATWAAAASGRSGLRECLLRDRSPGGCAVNTGDGLAALGIPVDAFIGADDQVAEVFAPLVGGFRSCVDLGFAPGRSVVMSFDDGKLMFSFLEGLAAVSAERLRAALVAGGFRERVAAAPLLMLTCWSLFPHMNDGWRMLQDLLVGLPRRPRIVIDLADPVNRRADLPAMLRLLPGFQAVGPVSLSVNENEARQLGAVLACEHSEAGRLAQQLQAAIGIDEVIIHRLRDAIQADAHGCHRALVPYVEKPLRTVGGGDRFNAGYCCGHLLEMPPAERLVLATTCSACFVASGRSASLSDIAAALADPVTVAVD